MAYGTRGPNTFIVVSSGRCSPSKDEMACDALFLAKPYMPGVIAEVLRDIRQQVG